MTDAFTFNEEQMLRGIRDFHREQAKQQEERLRAETARANHEACEVEKTVAVQKKPPARVRRKVDPSFVINLVCAQFSVEREHIMGEWRETVLRIARHTAMFLLRQECGMSVCEVSRVFIKHHTSISYATRSIELKANADGRFRAVVEKLRNEIRAGQTGSGATPLDLRQTLDCANNKAASIANDICRHFGSSLSFVASSTRKGHAPRARKMVALILHRELELNTLLVGQVLGRDFLTTRKLINQAERYEQVDPIYRKAVQTLAQAARRKYSGLEERAA